MAGNSVCQADSGVEWVVYLQAEWVVAGERKRKRRNRLDARCRLAAAALARDYTSELGIGSCIYRCSIMGSHT